MAKGIEQIMIESALLKSNPRRPASNGLHGGSEVGRAAELTPIPAPPPDMETLRRQAWDIGARHAWDQYQPPCNHIALGMVNPTNGFAHWRINQKWIDDTAWSRGQAWFHCRLVLRLYDISFITFNGFNAHRIQDVDLPGIAGQVFYNLPRPGTFQLGEVGFVLRGGEFIPAARSQVCQFASDSVSPRHDHSALLVDDNLGMEEVGNLWEQGRVLEERRKPRLRDGLRFASFSFETSASGQQSTTGKLAHELAVQQAALGHEAHLFVPVGQLKMDVVIDGVRYHVLKVRSDGSPIERALDFARVAETALRQQEPFDLIHLHEWMTGLMPWLGSRPTMLSINSLESSRLNGAPASDLSREIMKVERELAHGVDCILTPDWLRGRAIHEFAIDGSIVHAFPMEARLPDEWECPLDLGEVKRSIGFGPLDQLLVFVGPLEHAAGVDILLETMPTLVGRSPKVRLALIGLGDRYAHLEWMMHKAGLSHVVRLLGHVQRAQVINLVRAAEALVLPSRHRWAQDDAVVDLARRAGRPVVTTNGGPCHLVRHEENGIVAFDNPNSMVWALERVLREPGHALNMGLAGKRKESTSVSWAEVGRRYLELCAQTFPELTEVPKTDRKPSTR